MSKFRPITFYRESSDSRSYKLLPFRFTSLDDNRYVLSNMVGEHVVLAETDLRKFASHQLESESSTYASLRANHFLVDDQSSIGKDLLSIKVRTRYERLAEFTSLHIFVLTLRCEHSCPYCQVSRRSDDRVAYDMTRDRASAAIDLVLRSPAKRLKVEFQGGEPLLNIELLEYIILEFRRRAPERDITYVVATNLALLSDAILEVLGRYDVFVSTSLDGPRELHNRNRPRPGGDSYERTIAGISKVREVLGKDRVSALMTTTERSLSQVVGIVDEYVATGFEDIFLRPLSPYGFAVKTKQYQKYQADRWLQFYKQGLEYIIDLNRNGTPFREHFASIILKKMLTSMDPGYVDLMSPSGIGIGAIVYNYDGGVYASDEGRMLAEMGDQTFKLGELMHNSYEEILLSPKLLDPLEQSFALSSPQCTDCAFEPYCGSDPVYHWAQHRDYVGRKPESEFCRKNMGIFRYLIDRMSGDPFVRRLFMAWAN